MAVSMLTGSTYAHLCATHKQLMSFRQRLSMDLACALQLYIFTRLRR